MNGSWGPREEPQAPQSLALALSLAHCNMPTPCETSDIASQMAGSGCHYLLYRLPEAKQALTSDFLQRSKEKRINDL